MPRLTALILFIWGFAAPAFAVTLDEVAAGTLLLKTERPGDHVAAPLVATDIDIAVTGPIARTVMTQRFRNPSDGWVEGVYAFPLPEDAAVDTLRMRVGDRFVAGRIEERREAEILYEEAKAEGKVAALVEQHRPNLFTTSVANIGPGEVIVAQIEYQSTLAPKDGEFSLRLPLVAAPRYGGAPVAQAVSFGANGWAVTPETPVADPRAEETGAIRNPVSLTVDLAPGFALGALESRFHEVEVEEREGGALVRLAGPVSADRDFVLTWTPEAADVPTALLHGENAAGAGHLILTIAPPEPAAAAAETPPRDVIFVQDVSGSMAGESIRQARAGLEAAIRRLTPRDRFTIIAFNDRYAVWAPEPVDATPVAVANAIAEVRALEADGGTEMMPALDRALRMKGGEERLRQIVFLTDGAVSYEAEMLAMIHEKLGSARLFTVGIGSAPNGYFMTRAAEIGRGAHVYIGDLAEVQAKMEALFAKLETPAVTDLTLDLPAGVEAHPQILPDLYAGEPLTVALKGAAGGSARLTGRRGGQPFAMEIDLAAAAARPGVAKLYGRRKIAALEAARVMGADPEATDAMLLETALNYGLVSRLTALIAVDDQPVRPFAARLTRAEVARALPAGWDPRFFVFEQPPAPAQGDRAEIPGLLKTAAPAMAEEAGAFVPKGALNWRLTVLLGALTAALGLALLTGGGRRHA